MNINVNKKKPRTLLFIGEVLKIILNLKNTWEK